MEKISKHIHCDNCNFLTETKTTTLEVPRFGKIYELHDVQAEICPNCGATYISARAAKDFEDSFQKSVQK
ncbi:MAG: YgiT-type zinc finger protein [Pyrinomonadaceae bacterium]